LYQVTVANVNQHLKAIFAEGELTPGAIIKQYLIVQIEGSRQVSRLVDRYSLDAILAVGYRIRSSRGTAFRQWATARLSELLIKGFTMDDERLTAGRTLGDSYKGGSEVKEAWREGRTREEVISHDLSRTTRPTRLRTAGMSRPHEEFLLNGQG
jgi:hypothetical protein